MPTEEEARMEEEHKYIPLWTDGHANPLELGLQVLERLTAHPGEYRNTFGKEEIRRAVTFVMQRWNEQPPTPPPASAGISQCERTPGDDDPRVKPASAGVEADYCWQVVDGSEKGGPILCGLVLTTLGRCVRHGDQILPNPQPAREGRYRAFGIYVSEAGGETICEALGFTREEAEASAVKVAAALNVAHDVAISGVEYNAGKYVTVQIDRETWDELRQFVGRE